MKRAALAVFALMLCAQQASADEAADKVLGCMRGNIPQTLRVQTFEITSVDRSKGQRTLRGRLFAKNDNGLMRSMIKILAPSDLANASYLMREGKEKDEMYVYLPALNRVRRITGASADGPLFGTDLSYADMKQVENAFSGGPVKLEKPEQLELRDMYVLSMVPRADSESRYSLIKGWVDQKTCVALKVEFYEGATARKRLSGAAAALKQSGTHWYLTEALMQDLKDGTQTTLKITGLTSDDKMSDAIFGPTTFYIGG